MYKVERLQRPVHFNAGPTADPRHPFDSAVVDTDAKRPADRVVCVAPYAVACKVAVALNAHEMEEQVLRDCGQDDGEVVLSRAVS